MVIFKIADQIAAFLSGEKDKNKTIGFVPTMGALHPGHASLVKICKEQNEIAVCSIFINPAQFNNAADFELYPVSIEKDIELLIIAGCDVLFLPSAKQIYPEDYQKKIYSLGSIETVLEGHYRPGHFQGVSQVMDRLLQIIQPNNLYVGQKDYQQCMVIHKLIQLLGKEKEYNLIIQPTIREDDGLAMSSRNLRLSKKDRPKAAALYRALNYIKTNFQQLPLEPLKINAMKILEKEGFMIDYVALADAYTLEVSNQPSQKTVALIAATINNIRLIDNLILN